MINNQLNHKINPGHLARKAIVYLRQSSPRQVHANTESQRLQYALADRAKAYGWRQVEVIDRDLGCSAAMGSNRREGFKQVLASVAMGEVGIIFSREVSRLSRTDKDWCHLIEICQLHDTLIGDADQIYDTNCMDDQLVLGIKGTLSVVELKVLRMRLLQGQEEKARRGELLRKLPPGYVVDGNGKIIKDPNARVREAIELVFKKYREIWSIRQTFIWFHEQEVKLPVNKPGKSCLHWKLPSKSFVQAILKNPMYAGAYVYGQRQVEMVIKDDKLVKRQGRLRRPDEARVFIRDHHEGYVSWGEYEENREMMRKNALDTGSDEVVKAVRSGQGLLAGILRCGRCGRKLHVRYWGKSGTAARYLCKGDYESGGKYCLGFGGKEVDREIGDIILKVVSPLGLEASLLAIEKLKDKVSDRYHVMQRQLQQLRYEERRAYEQYDQADPRNRLVTEELERRWNEKLEEVEKLESMIAVEQQEEVSLGEMERESILAMGRDFSGVWENEACPIELKKKIVRTLIEEIIVDEGNGDGKLRFVIHWKGGCHTELKRLKPQPANIAHKTSLEDVELIGRMVLRYPDKEIARVLNKLGRKTGKGGRWTQLRVADIRRKYSIPNCNHEEKGPEILTMRHAARYSGVSVTTVKRLVESGILKKEQIVPHAPWEIRRSDLDSEPVVSIIRRLKATGKLDLGGEDLKTQQMLFE